MADEIDSRRDFYVYAYLRDGGPVYIGKGCGKRWLRHASATGQNQRLHRMIQKDRREGTSRITREKLADGLSEVEAFALEVDLIARYGRTPNGPLVNMTDGGEGAVNPSPEVRARVSTAVSASLMGHVVSEDTRAKLRAALTGRPRSQAASAKAAASNRGRKRTDEQRARMSAAQMGNKHNLGKPCSDEKKAAIRAAQVGRKSPPEWVAKAVAANTGKKRTDEQRAAMSAVRKGRSLSPEHRAALQAAQTPELRARRSAAAKAAWSRRKSQQ